MKKLLIAMMSVASLAFISKADAINSGTTFEGYNGTFAADKDDTGGNDGTFWYTAGSSTDCASLTNTDYTATYTGETPAIHTTETDGEPTALAVEAEQRLERGIVGYNEETGFVAQDIGAGIYFDTMVQFTATDTAPTPASEDKLIVWLYGSGEEDGAFGIGTNLVVTAGYLNDTANTSIPKNYVVTSTPAVEPNSWHRLTIKSIKALTTDEAKVPGFVVFIDGVAVSSTEAKGVDGSAMSALNATAAKWDSTNTLFPSLITKKDSAQTLSSVALEGTGMIDDISFTTTAPAFAGDAPTVVISWGDGVAAVQYKVGEGALVDAVNGATITLEAAGTVTVVPTYVTGYVADEWVFNGAATTASSFDISAPATIEVVAKQQLIRVGDETFASVESLVAWLNSDAQSTFSGTITLLGDVNVGKVVDDYSEILTVQAGQNVILDLAGHNLCGTNAATQAAVANLGGTLTIVNSTETIGHISMVTDPTDEESMTFAVYSADGTLNITAGYIDGAVVAIDMDEDDDPGVINITGGSFVAADNDEEQFYLANYVAEGYMATYADGYWTVSEGDTPDPTTYTVTVNADTGTTVTGAPTKPVEENASVTLTVGLVDGYKNLVVTVNDEETSVVDGKVTFTVTADTTVNVSATVMATYTVTIAETLGDHVTKIEASPTSIREDAESKIVTLTATFEDDYELDYFTVDGVEIEDDTFELTANAVVNAVAKKTVGPEPEDWPADPSTVKGQTAGDAFGLTGDMAAAPADKVATWAKAKEVSFADRTTAIKIDAYLLNVDNTDAAIIAGKAAFKFTSITPGETPTIEGTFNGVVVVKAYLDAACTNEGTSEKATFYKATLEVTASVK